MTWNYRVVRTPQHFGVYEVYYDEEGRPIARSEHPVAPTSEDLDGLRERLGMVVDALDESTLTPEEIGTKKQPTS